jgi:hypothetical protein
MGPEAADLGVGIVTCRAGNASPRRAARNAEIRRSVMLSDQ